MLTPEQIRDIADTMIPLIDDLNNWIIRDIIKRLAARLGRGEAALLTATDEWQLQVYQEAGGHLQTVRRLLRRFMDASDEEIGQIFEDAGIKSLDADNRIYTAAGGRKLALSENMVRIMTDVYQRTKGTIHNFTRTTADHSQQKLIRVLDTAHWKVNSGAQSYTAAYLDAINEIADTQTEVVYPSGHVDTIETAVLRAVRTGTAQAAGNLSIQGMEEHGWDLIRVSAHLGARYGDGGENPGNHFWWQGKLYSRSGEDTNYPPFIETTGYGTGEGLCGWNCRHSFGPGDPNHNPFKGYDSEENKEAYDLSQKQRRMERGIRKSKSKLMALKTAIDATEDPAAKSELEEAYIKAALRLKGQSEAYNQFCEDNDLKRFDDRLQVAKWDREQARRAIQAAQDTEKPLALSPQSGTIGADIRVVQTGAVSRFDYILETGAKKTDGWQDRHAERYYEEVRNRAAYSDATKIAANITGFTVEDIEDIRQHVFIREHPRDGRVARFDADYEQAQVWQRLVEGKDIWNSDIVLLRHEQMESHIMRETGCTYEEAHEQANAIHNWYKEYKKDAKMRGKL